ncbi:MAG: hypothetical protein CMH66_06255 [Nioella sp.]|nr:hypothetical protein [Nioella sp.]
MTQTDSLGRSTFHHIAPQTGVRPTNREIRWLKHIERHGPQSSQYLFELTRDTHRCKDTALRQMQKLRAGGFLRLPQQQRATEHSDFNPYVYDLTRAAKDHLFDLGLAEPTVRPTGHWWHGFATSCVTSSIDIAAARRGVRYIPAHTILAKRGVTLEIPMKHGKLIPDQLFALDYGGSFRVFMLEVDRGTEPIKSTAARKSLGRSIDQYLEVQETQLHKSHYGLKANMLVLWLFNSQRRQHEFHEILKERSPNLQQSTLTKVANFGELPRLQSDTLFSDPWKRSLGSDFSLCD